MSRPRVSRILFPDQVGMMIISLAPRLLVGSNVLTYHPDIRRDAVLSSGRVYHALLSPAEESGSVHKLHMRTHEQARHVSPLIVSVALSLLRRHRRSGGHYPLPMTNAKHWTKFGLSFPTKSGRSSGLLEQSHCITTLILLSMAWRGGDHLSAGADAANDDEKSARPTQAVQLLPPLK